MDLIAIMNKKPHNQAFYAALLRYASKLVGPSPMVRYLCYNLATKQNNQLLIKTLTI